MELEKRLESLDDRYNCLRLPHTPRAARSARRRCLFKRKGDVKQMCAFDLLATVAGRLLSDRESSQLQSVVEQSPLVVAPIVKKEKDEGGNKPRDQDCWERNFIITELVSEVPGQNSCSNELACAQNDPGYAITPSGFSEKVGPAEKLIDDDCNLRLGISNPVDGESSGFRLSANCGSEDNSRETANNTRNLSIGYRENQDGKPSELVCSVVNNVKFPFPRDQAPCGSFPVSRENVKLVSSRDDDDENSFEYTEPSSTRNKAIKPLPPRPGDRRFRRLVPSNNAASSHYPTNQNCAKWQRSPRDYPFKKRKLYECGSGSTSDEGGAPEKVISGDERLGSSPGGGYGSFDSFHSQNTPVKLKIKSFKVPELYIEIPETSTVGSLKKTVMESVNSVLGGGLRVGVLLQGKKIRDDNKTLAQTGISHNSKIDSLGFTLEPNSPLPAPPIRLYPEARLGQSPHSRRSSADDIFIRYPPTARSGGRQRHLDPSPDLPGPSFNNDSESKALVPLSSAKFKRSESAQRRIRRPFTVAEVEALVQAVEKLGTGRWRDVKLRAFDNAKHRTYVDLKDKWKTLVHTARISPQQRRGEPVPQELLDRVLTAHAYWSQQQSKQQLKSQPDTCLLL